MIEQLEAKIITVAEGFNQEERLWALVPKFERELSNSPFAFYGTMRQITELKDGDSAYSQFIRDFLCKNGIKESMKL